MRLVSILSRDGARSRNAMDELESSFGRIVLSSRPYPFDMSGYYEQEMGEGLERIWLAFETLAPPERIVEWKTLCAGMEDRLRDGRGRTVYLDPGYMDLGKLVLASFKEAPDKVYMGRGVWAHTCLRYGSGGFRAPGHSFPDFKDGRFDEYMMQVRDAYKHMLRSIRGAAR
jgi:hypothetical protein